MSLGIVGAQLSQTPRSLTSNNQRKSSKRPMPKMIRDREATAREAGLQVDLMLRIEQLESFYSHRVVDYAEDLNIAVTRLNLQYLQVKRVSCVIS